MIVQRDIDKIIVSAVVILCAIFISFRQIMQADDVICIMLLMTTMCILYRRRKKLLYVTSSPIAIWVVCICWMAFSVLHTYSLLSGVKFFSVFATFVLCGIVLTSETDWYDLFIGIMKKFLVFHALFTFFQFFLPKISLKITGLFLDADSQILTREWIEQNRNYAGISGQTMINAFYFILLGGICISELMQNDFRLKITDMLILVISFIGLVLTGKKGAWLATLNCFAIVIFIYMSASLSKKHLKAITWILIFSTVGAIMMIIRIGDDLLNIMLGSSVISRERIIYNAKQIFSEHPWIGSGTDSIAYYIAHSTHNIYIQVLCEYGIIGEIIFIFALIYTEVITIIKIYKKSRYGLELGSDLGRMYLLVFYNSFILINGFTENTLFTYQFFLPYMLLIAAAYQPTDLKGETNGKKTS